MGLVEGDLENKKARGESTHNYNNRGTKANVNMIKRMNTVYKYGQVEI
jgi:hypothetical protein